jgi:hypothetical protein
VSHLQTRVTSLLLGVKNSFSLISRKLRMRGDWNFLRSWPPSPWTLRFLVKFQNKQNYKRYGDCSDCSTVPTVASLPYTWNHSPQELICDRRMLFRRNYLGVVARLARPWSPKHTDVTGHSLGSTNSLIWNTQVIKSAFSHSLSHAETNKQRNKYIKKETTVASMILY